MLEGLDAADAGLGVGEDLLRSNAAIGNGSGESLRRGRPSSPSYLSAITQTPSQSSGGGVLAYIRTLSR